MTTRKNNNEEKSEYVSKPGRTLLVKTENTKQKFDNVKGLQSTAETKSGTSRFLTFDTVENATSALESLKKKGLQVKYSYYRVFFVMQNAPETVDYNETKTELTDLVTEKFSGSVLYCKLYRKGQKNLNYGYMTVDTIDTMNRMIAKENKLEKYSFYRYNNKKDKQKPERV